MDHLFITFAAIVASSGVLGLVRMAGLCSRDEESARAATLFGTAAAASEPSTLAFSPAV